MTTHASGPYSAFKIPNDRLERWSVLAPPPQGYPNAARAVLATGIRGEAQAILFAEAPEVLELLAWAIEHADAYVTRELSDGAFGMADDLAKLHRAKEILGAAFLRAA